MPSGQRSLSDVKGSTSQAIHITDTMEKPTYVVTDISSPLRRLSSRAYSQPATAAMAAPTAMANRKPPQPGMPYSMVIRPPMRPATRPMGRPRFRLMPHWMPGTMASTMMAFMPMRTTLLESSVGSDRSYSSASRHKRIKNRLMMMRGMPSFSTSERLNSRASAASASATPQ